ncbi:TetR/AcrR family transcriptional regulator [Xanthobacter oligotrophicus]|uniref:TetR/AcrR family transcriptional regulator n=1 Tax=Xanthobacter oligotrophicus TaxID=2607286 RepID=UPI0011F2FE40|nr:TetR/AcrR family transcriptional regulator [Xanthobacter oligotrophicus]MCG5234346.1 TetR/AcrR family transcriptional regulator [Xanthobacter oligotrophicus]
MSVGVAKDGRSNRPRAPQTAKREAILAAARKLVARSGFKDTQINAVAETANVALGTLYRYFPSKAELMVEVVGLVAQREVDAVGRVADGDGTPTERLSASAWLFASRALLGRKMAHALVAEPVEPEIESARLIYRRKLARIFEAIIEQGITRGEFPEQDVQASGACIVGSLFEGLVGPLALDSFSTDAERQNQAKAIVAFCVRGVGG